MNRQTNVILAGSRLRVGLILLLAAALTAGTGLLAPHPRAEEPLAAGPTAPESPREQAVRTDRYGDPLPDGAITRLGTSRLRHGKGPGLYFAAEGKALLSASGDDLTLRVWDPDTGRQLSQVRLQSGRQEGFPDCYSLQFSQDGKSVLGWSNDSWRLWDAATGNERCRMTVPAYGGIQVALSPDGKTVASTFYERLALEWKVHLWDATTGKEYPHSLPFAEHLAFSPDGKTLATTVHREGFRLSDVATGKELCLIRGNASSPTFSPDGKTLAVGGTEGAVVLWDVAARKELATLRKPASRIFPLTFSPDGTVLAVEDWGAGAGVGLWDVAGRKELRKLPCGPIHHVCFAPDGKTLAVSRVALDYDSELSVISLWDVATGRRLGQGDGHEGEVVGVEFLPDGRTLVSLSKADGTVRLWDLTSSKQLRQLEKKVDNEFAAVAAGPDGRTVLSDTIRDTLRLLDAVTGKELRRFVVPTAATDRGTPSIHSFRLTTDRTRLAAVSQAVEGCGGTFQAAAWDIATGKLLANRRWPDPSPFPPCLAPDARRVAVWGVRDVRVEDIITGEELVTFAGTRYNCPTFSPDGRVLVTAVFGGKREEMRWVDLWELASGKRLLRIETGPAAFLTFSPDGRVLATASQEALCLWDVATGRELFRRPAHERFRGTGPHGAAFVSSLAFAPDGRTLATGLIDSTVLVWDLAPDTWNPGPAARDLSPDDLAGLWSELAGEDAGKAHRAMGVLAAAPAQAVPFLKKHLCPAVVPDVGCVRRWIADLDSDEFAVRDAASKALAARAEQIEPLLRQALDAKPTPEARKRLEDLLAEARQAARRVVLSPEALRTLRAIQTLEWCSTKGAVELLQALAAGEPGARQTREVKDALTRLSPPPSAKP
jgi:WD40 repeat protein